MYLKLEGRKQINENKNLFVLLTKAVLHVILLAKKFLTHTLIQGPQTSEGKRLVTAMPPPPHPHLMLNTRRKLTEQEHDR